jgi:putative ABC transport system permease protein
MSQLTADHIDYVRRDLTYRGIIEEGIQEELMDHICSAVEIEMQKGSRFIDAYHGVLRAFGHNTGLRQTQQSIIKSKNETTSLMVQNYITIAIRNLKKHRFYSFINVSGLAMGIAACLIIVLYVANELSYDKHHQNGDRIYRVNAEIKFGSNHYKQTVTPAPLAETLLNEFPEVEAVARFRTQGTWPVKRDKDIFRESGITYADNSIFKVFTIPLLHGNSDKALTEPNTIVISKKIALKYFPGEDPLGKTLTFFENWTTHVSGVMEDMPVNSHFHFDILLAMPGLDESKNTNWLSNNFHTYVLLEKSADARAFEAKLPEIVKTHVGPQAAEVLGGDFSLDKFLADGNIYRHWLTGLHDIHLSSDLQIEIEPNGDITYVYLFSAVAFFILGIACINFMNLSTARSSNRAKEVGIRKVLGSLRSHLVRQFLVESIMLSLGAVVLAVILSNLLLPTFNLLASKQLELPFNNPWFYLVILALGIILGILAGMYPSFFLSAFRPSEVLKGKLALGMKSGVIRSGLVVFQFSISIFLIIATLVVHRQLDFIQHKKIGFNKDQVIVIQNAYSLKNQLQSFKEEVLKDPKIINGTISGYLPVSGFNRSDNSHWPEGKLPTSENMVGIQTWEVDYDYVRTLGMKIVDGRDFSPDFPSDSSAIILNQAAVKAFGFTDPIGKKITTFHNTDDNSIDKSATISFTVIGVVEDFHYESLRQNITPLYLHLATNRGNISFRFEARNTGDVIKRIEQTWKLLAPGQPFEYSFLNDEFGRMYASEERLGTIFAIFAFLAIMIACLGVFGLSSFTAEQRTKEIGIRKVLGASVASIVILLSKEFGKLIAIAFILAAPFAWIAIDWWLKNYTYKVQVGIGMYVLAGALAVVTTWLTMGYQSIKAANSNPVKSLRSE